MFLGGQKESPKPHNWTETSFVLPSSLSSYSSAGTGTWGISPLIPLIHLGSSSSRLPVCSFPTVPAPRLCHSLLSCLTSSCPWSDTHPAQHQLQSKMHISSLCGCSCSFIKQLQKSQPPATQVLSPRNLSRHRRIVLTATHGTAGDGEKGKKSQ